MTQAGTAGVLLNSALLRSSRCRFGTGVLVMNGVGRGGARTARRGTSAERRPDKQAEVSHQPPKRRERQLRRLKLPRHAQQFLSAQSRIYNHFQLHRHRLTTNRHRTARASALRIWREVTSVTAAA